MPSGTMDEFLKVVSEAPNPRHCEILSHHRYKPGQRNGSLNMVSRLGSRARPKLTPYKEVLHALRRKALLGVKHADSARPFVASDMFNGMGEPDERFPDLAVRHKTMGQRYLVFWPTSAAGGKLVPNESRYYDQTGRELDFKSEVEEYWKKSGKPKGPAIEGEIHWSVVKFEGIAQIEFNGETWTIHPD